MIIIKLVYVYGICEFHTFGYVLLIDIVLFCVKVPVIQKVTSIFNSIKGLSDKLQDSK